jgi:outer membrane lipase/esterase
MKNFRAAALAGVAALLLAACGGGDSYIPGSGSPDGAPTTKGSFAALVSFGDSLSDIGAYAPVTSLSGNGRPPYFGGKFTTNGPGGTVWVENLAAALGLVVTPAEVGFAGQSVKCPAPPSTRRWPAPAPPTGRAARASPTPTASARPAVRSRCR